MPCYQTNLISADIHAADRTLLLAAIEAMNLKYVVLSNGNIAVATAYGQIIIGDKSAMLPMTAQAILNGIKVNYSKQVVRHLAAKRRLTITEKEENYDVLRGY